MDALLGKKILIVDDEPLLREVLLEFFVLEGATVIEADGGLVGFKKLQENKVDILISDMRMPGGDGLSLLKKIQTDLDYKPLIFLYSGHTESLSETNLQLLGVAAYLVKPFSARDLIKKIASYG